MKKKLLFLLILTLILGALSACGRQKGPILQGVTPSDDPAIEEDQKPNDTQPPSGEQSPDDNENPGDNEDPGNNEKPGDNEDPGNNENPGNETKPNPNAGISLDTESLSLKIGESALLAVRFTPKFPDDDTTLTFTVSDKTVISVDGTGLVGALSAGSATVTVTCGEFSADCTVTVTRRANENPGIFTDGDSIRLQEGDSSAISATLVPRYEDETASLSYRSDDPSVASVDESGRITAHKAGVCILILTGGGFEERITVTVTAVTQKPSFSFLAAGDNLLHAGVYSDANKLAGGSGYDFSAVYAAIADKVKNADFSMINQETVFTGDRPSSYPSLNAPQEAVKALADLGFDIISLANNHCLDKGGTGLAKSMTYLDSLKTVIRLGAYFKKNNDSLKIRVIEKNGIKVALLAYTTFTNGDIPADYNSSGVYVPWAVESNMVDDIARAKTKADAVLVFMHWGEEEQFAVSDKQKKLAQLLADNGADIIIGAHPHVIQPVEIITAQDGKSVPCIYSLGTLVSNMATEKNMLSCLVSFDFVKDPESGVVTVENIEMDPYVFYYDMEYRQSALYRITDFTDALADSHGVGNYPKDSTVKNTVSVKRLYGYLEKYIDAKYLPSDVLNAMESMK